MNDFKHPAVASAISIQMIDMLIGQMESTPMERVRESAMQHLYSVGATLQEISQAYQRDLEAGDRILSQRSHEEQNAAPETQQWLKWLHAYEAVETQLARIKIALAANDERSAA